jgi:putative tricarboxylic transport membrane protein
LNAPHNAEEETDISSRGPELAVAVFLMALAALVIVDSLRVGIGWGDDGPRSGYFPFYIGLALLGSAAWIAIGQLRRWNKLAAFASRAQIKSVWSVLWPMVVYVALIKPLGIYAPSALLIAWFMARHGKHRWITTAAVAVGVPIVFFLVFERAFKVPLPKGPLEALLGF